MYYLIKGVIPILKKWKKNNDESQEINKLKGRILKVIQSNEDYMYLSTNDEIVCFS